MRRILAILVAGLLVSGQAPTPPSRVRIVDVESNPPTPPPPVLGRIQPANVVKVGTFKVPANVGYEYGGAAMSFNPERNSLFLVGHEQEQKLGEISIPAAGGTATLLQPLTKPGGAFPLDNGRDTVRIGGTLPIGTDYLLFTKYIYYDGSKAATASHFTRPRNLASGSVVGPVKVGPLYQSFYAGYMTWIPEEWQARFGGPAITGNGPLQVISRTSFGPGAFVFDPSTLSQAVPLVYYPEAHPTLGAWTDPGVHPIWNISTFIRGVVFPVGSSSVLFFGRTGLGTRCYGEAAACGDPTNSDKGNHAHPYTAYVWAYDADELLTVKNGQKQPWEIRPYAHWDLKIVANNETCCTAAYDPATQRIFLAIPRGDGLRPLIHIFAIR